MNSHVFREYDIRGIVEDDFDDAFVVDLGRGYATLLHRAGKKTITLGRDCRLSSDRLRDRLAEGLLSAGINLVDIGVVPTPLLYFSVLSWKMDGGAMITGSHNAAEYNGFKLGVGPTTIHGAEIQRLREIIERRDFVTTGAKGSYVERPVIPDYNDFIMSQFKLTPGLKVVVDGGNGCGGVIAAPLMKRLGLDTIELYTEMDGRFPNHHPDPTVEDNMRDLIAAVKKKRGGWNRVRRRRRSYRRGGRERENRLGRRADGGVLARDSARASRRDDYRRGEVLEADVRRHRKPRRPADHVEDGAFADQEQAERGARGAGGRDEWAHVFCRPLFRLRRRDLRIVSPAGNS